MESLVRFTLEQKIFFNLVFILLTIAGFFALFAMPAERYPDINMATVNITTEYPGASPTDVETLVTRKIEEAIENIENIEWIASTSQPERSYIRVKFVDDSDYDQLYDEIRFNILNAKADLPAETDQPKIENVTMGVLLPVLIVNLSGDHSNRALSLMAEQVKLPLQRIPGVKRIAVSGEFTREFHIYLDPERLRRFGIGFDEISEALQDANLSVTAGKFKTQTNEYLLKVDEKFSNRSDIAKTIVRRDGDGGFIRLEDLITRADYDFRTPSVISTINGKNAIALNVIKTPEGNALAIKESVEKILSEFQPLFDKEQLEITLTQDSSVRINDGLSTLGWNLAVGMLLVSLITWFFMGLRNAALITIGIPFSFLITLLIMYLTGYSFNELTLFAFVLVSGIIVDDAIVITDNIYRHIQLGKQTYQAIIKGTEEVALPVIASSLTTIAAFLPMLIMTGTTGEFFAQIPMVVTYALLASLFESLFILPVHYLDFGPQKSMNNARQLEKDNYFIAVIRVITLAVLNWTLRFRAATILLVTSLFLISIGIMYVSAAGILPLVKTQFFPDDYALYFVDIKAPPNTSIYEMDRKARQISERILEEGPGRAASATGMAGVFMNEDYELIFGNNYGVVLVTLPAKKDQSIDDPMRYLETIRTRLKQEFERDGLHLSVHPMKEGPPAGKAINIKIMGSDLNAVSLLADNMLDYLETAPGIAPYLVELEDNRGLPKKVFRFAIRDERVKEYNFSISDVARFAGSVLDGRYIGKFRSSDEEIDLKLAFEPDLLATPEQALAIPFAEHAVGPILLGDLTQLTDHEEVNEFQRFQGQRTISIKADLQTGSPISSAFVTRALIDHYETVRDTFPGASVIFSGEYESTQKSYQSLIFAFFIAIIIVYMILAAQFQSYIQPAIILFSVIFAITGVILGKFFTQSLFTVNSFIAVIGVVGVVVNDALVLVDFINKNYRSGLSRRESIDEAIRVRLRPIIITTITTILGLLPMALGIPNYSIVWGTMATTFVAGLGFATMLTLIVVPVLWDLIQARKEKKLQ